MSIKNVTIFILILVLGVTTFLIFRNNGMNNLENEEEIKEEVDREATEKIKDILIKGREIDSLVYDVKMYKFGEVFSLRFWERGEKMRMDASFQGRTMINLWDKEKEFGYLYTAGDTTATKLEAQQATDIFYSSVKEWIKDALYYDIIVKRREIFNEEECLVLSYKKNERDIEMWIIEDLGLPIKIVVQEEWGEVEIIIANIDTKEIPNNVFSLPINMKVTEEFIYF